MGQHNGRGPHLPFLKQCEDKLQKALICGQYVKLFWSSINSESNSTKLPT